MKLNWHKREWGVIGAGPGVVECLDYLETDKAVNAKQVAIIGAPD